MSLKPNPDYTVPEETARVARAIYPKGNLYMNWYDTFGPLFDDNDFADLFSHEGQPALSCVRLALVSIVQFVENLTDRQAAEAVRSRIDVKYLLCLELTDPGFDHTVLSEFRARLIDGSKEQMVFDRLLTHFQEHDLLADGVKQRTDSTHVCGAIRALNRIECVGEAKRRRLSLRLFRHALNTLAIVAPDWTLSHTPPDWVDRYGTRIEAYRLPKSQEKQNAYVQQVGADGLQLLQAIDDKNTPAWLSELDALRLVLHPGAGMTGSVGLEKNIPFEWRVSVEKWHSDPSKAPTLVTMELCSLRSVVCRKTQTTKALGGMVRLDRIKVPLNIEVKSGGEIEKFVAEHSEHEARGKAKSQRETILPLPEMDKTTGLPSGVITTGEPDASAEPPDRKEAPDFSLKAINGKTIKLSDFKGKVVILNFWATWAPQHTREMAALEELYRTYQEELVVLGVSVDSVNSDNTDAVKAYIEKRSVTYPILIAPIDTLYDYEIACESPIVTIPTTIIIDKGGFIRSKHVGAQHKAALERAYLSARNGVDVPPRSHGRVGFTKTGKSSVWTVNRALRLDGDGYVIIHPFDIPATAITAEFWMKSSDTTKKGNPLSYQVEVGHSHHHMGSGQNVNWPAGVVR